MGINRDLARNKAIELIKKVDDCVCGDINLRNTNDMVTLILDEINQSNPTIKGNSHDLITQIVQTKAYYCMVKEELDNIITDY